MQITGLRERGKTFRVQCSSAVLLYYIHCWLAQRLRLWRDHSMHAHGASWNARSYSVGGPVYRRSRSGWPKDCGLSALQRHKSVYVYRQGACQAQRRSFDTTRAREREQEQRRTELQRQRSSSGTAAPLLQLARRAACQAAFSTPCRRAERSDCSKSRMRVLLLGRRLLLCTASPVDRGATSPGTA